MPRVGIPVVLDTARGRHEGDGIVQYVPGRNRPVDGKAIQDFWYAKQAGVCLQVSSDNCKSCRGKFLLGCLVSSLALVR